VGRKFLKKSPDILSKRAGEFSIWGQEENHDMRVAFERVHFDPGPTCQRFAGGQSALCRRSGYRPLSWPALYWLGGRIGIQASRCTTRSGSSPKGDVFDPSKKRRRLTLQKETQKKANLPESKGSSMLRGQP
jgi:hypothetical protein